MKRKFIMTTIFLVLVGFGAGIFVLKRNKVEPSQNCLLPAQYINPLLECGEKYRVDKRSYTKLKNRLHDFVMAKTKDGEVTNVSIYFRDLYNGPTMGVNEHTSFAPASLLKVPVLLAYLNIAEQKPSILEQELTYEVIEDTYKPVFPPKDPVKVGVVYSVNDLLSHMIKQSDNQAYYVLKEYLRQISPEHDLLQETFWDLGIVDSENPQADLVTVKSYASIFTQLYHNSFFTRKETAEQALALLADTDFHQGMEAGVPAGVKLAHKFGERVTESGQSQLQDCGIVYYPKNPYSVCIMAQGHDFGELAAVIRIISKMVYEEFDSRKL